MVGESYAVLISALNLLDRIDNKRQPCFELGLICEIVSGKFTGGVFDNTDLWDSA